MRKDSAGYLEEEFNRVAEMKDGVDVNAPALEVLGICGTYLCPILKYKEKC